MLSAVACYFAGCGRAVERELEQTVERTYPMNPTGSFSIRTPNGSVSIYGSDAVEMKLKAVKRAWTAERLKGIAVEVAIRPNSIAIETRFAPEKGLSSSSALMVDYTVTLPHSVRITRLDVGNGDIAIVGMRGEDVRATLVNGQLSAKNCFGNAHLAVANGALNLLYDWWEQGSFSINGQITAGNARVTIPRSASFHVNAETANGKVINDFSETVELGGRAATKIDKLVGEGAHPEIRIRATNGDITIAGFGL
jgi:hypothetical protein